MSNFWVIECCLDFGFYICFFIFFGILILVEVLIFIFLFREVRLIVGYYYNYVGVMMIRTLNMVLWIEMRGGFKRLFYKKELINFDNF